MISIFFFIHTYTFERFKLFMNNNKMYRCTDGYIGLTHRVNHNYVLSTSHFLKVSIVRILTDFFDFKTTSMTNSRLVSVTFKGLFWRGPPLISMTSLWFVHRLHSTFCHLLAIRPPCMRNKKKVSTKTCGH